MDDTWQPQAPPARHLVRPVPLDPAGVDGPTRHQARRSNWRRTSHGLYVPAGTERTVEQRILEQSMRLDGSGAVTGWAALRMYGAAFFDGLEPDGLTPIPVQLLSPSRLANTSESVVSRASLGKVWRVQGVRCVSVERALVDEIRRRGDLREAVVAIDMACAARITSLRRIGAYLRRLRGRIRELVQAALGLATEHSRSPMESRMRMVWVLDAGLPPPYCNRLVYALDGSVLGTPDLLDATTGVAGEYDGALHRSRSRHRRDVERRELFTGHGLETFTVVAGDSRRAQVTRMQAAHERAKSRAEPGAWTIDPPPGAWVPGSISIDEELAFRGWPTD